MGDEGVHQAARKHRDREQARAAADAAAASGKARKAPRSAKKMKAYRIREALAEAGTFGKVATNGALVIGLLAPMVGSVLVFGDAGFVVTALTVVATAITMWGLYSVAEMMVASMRLRRLIAIGRGLDVDAYLDALGENRRSAVVEVRATFDKPWPDGARTSAHDAVKEWMPSLASVDWAGRDTLVLRSANLSGRLWLSGGRSGSSGHYFDNREIHGAFMQIVDDVVPHLEEVARITHLAVALEGDVSAWDASPELFG